MPTRSWIIGRGMLGSAVAGLVDDAEYRPTIDWSDPVRAAEDLKSAVATFAAAAGGDWAIYWCAGRGVTSTPREAMLAEAEVFAAFLDEVEHRLGASPSGTLFLASSVGGAFGGSDGAPFSESTPAVPASSYGEAKLRMEHDLVETVSRARLHAFIARITNLYGPGQDLGKGQGLISVIVDSYVTGRPVSVYVPLDTLRDYIYVEDCARVIVAGSRRAAEGEPGSTVLKIVGAMNALSIGSVIGEMSRLRRKQVPVVLGQGDSTGQALDLRVRSEVWRDLDALVSTTVPAGLGALYRARLASHMLPSGRM